jgi:hypothetical protein
MHIVVVEMGTAAGLTADDQLPLRGRRFIEAPARFNALQDADEPGPHPMGAGDFPSDSFLVDLAGWEIAKTIPSPGLGYLRRRQNLGGYVECVFLEIPKKDMIRPEQTVHPLGAVERTQLALEDETIKTVQDASDEEGETL